MRNLRRFFALFLALVTVFAFAVTAAAEPAEELAYLNGQLRVGMECAYAPSNWQESAASDTNVPVENVPGAFAEGYDVQIARIIADYLGLELVIVKMDWDGLIEALNQGQIDAIIAGMADTAARRDLPLCALSYDPTMEIAGSFRQDPCHTALETLTKYLHRESYQVSRRRASGLFRVILPSAAQLSFSPQAPQVSTPLPKAHCRMGQSASQ